MADQWIDADYVDARMGFDQRQSLTQEQSVTLIAFIEMATAKVQGLVRAAGYTTPATTTDELCKMAVYALVFEMIAQSPANNLALPEKWEQSEYKKTLAQISNNSIEEGSIALTLPLASTGSAIGGWTTSTDNVVQQTCDNPTPVDVCARVLKATRFQLRGY